MRYLALLSLFISTAATGQTVDCEALKTTTTPVQITWRVGNASSFAIQIYRDKSGDFIFWRKAVSPGTVEVMKSVVSDGVGAEAITTNSRTGTRKSKSAFQGLPKNFDHRKDITYGFKSTSTLPDGTTQDTDSFVSYHFVAESRKVIGSCILTLVQGEIANIVDGRKGQPITVYYIQELKGALLLPVNDGADFELATSFVPLELLK